MLGFGKKPLVVWGVEPKLSTFTHWTEAKFIQRHSSKRTVNIRGTDCWFCIGMPRPSSTPLGECQSHFLRLCPFLKPIGKGSCRYDDTGANACPDEAKRFHRESQSLVPRARKSDGLWNVVSVSR
jgi:hypothetical protein